MCKLFKFSNLPGLQLTSSRTGEIPWVLEMIKKHHETAVTNKAIVREEQQFETEGKLM